MLRYPVVLERDDNGTFLVSFPDIPEAHTFGDTEEEALTRAVDALLTALEARIADRDPMPQPSEIHDRQPRVQMPALAEAKLVLYQTMRQLHVNKSQLARRLHVHPPQIDRLIDLRHQSRFEQLEAAFNALNRDIRICIQPREDEGSATQKRASDRRRRAEDRRAAAGR